MPSVKRPIRGSRGFWPKKRARRIYPRIKSWLLGSEAKPAGFVGYKAGMTHAMIIDTNSNSRTKGQVIAKPVTVLECPPVSVFGFRCYNGSRSVCDVYADNINKNMKRKIKVPKKAKTQEQLSNLEGKNFTRVMLICHTNPTFKKKPEVFEIAVSGKVEEQLEFAKGILGKDVKMGDVYKDGDMVDVSAITKGKGFAGPVKRFGVFIQGRKYEQGHRKVSPLGSKEPGKVRSTVPQAGQLGFQQRTELNKRILKIGAEDVTPKGDFLRYGKLKEEAVLIEGSVPGPTKRLIKMRNPIRTSNKIFNVDLKLVSTESKQGA